MFVSRLPMDRKHACMRDQKPQTDEDPPDGCGIRAFAPSHNYHEKSSEAAAERCANPRRHVMSPGSENETLGRNTWYSPRDNIDSCAEAAHRRDSVGFSYRASIGLDSESLFWGICVVARNNGILWSLGTRAVVAHDALPALAGHPWFVLHAPRSNANTTCDPHALGIGFGSWFGSSIATEVARCLSLVCVAATHPFCDPCQAPRGCSEKYFF